MYANYQAVLEAFGENSAICKEIKQEIFQFSLLLVILNTGQTDTIVGTIEKITKSWTAESLLGDLENLSHKIIGIYQIQRVLTYEITNPISNSGTNNWEMEIHNGIAQMGKRIKLMGLQS